MWPTIFVAVCVFGVTALIIALEIRNRARGKISCGGNCANCNLCKKGQDTPNETKDRE